MSSRCTIRRLLPALALAGFVLTGCAPTSQTSQPEMTADAGSSSSAAISYSEPASSCGIGTYNAVFDDFAYRGTELHRIGSPFGQNEWTVCRNAEVDGYDSRFWYRFNPWDVGLTNAHYEVNGERGYTEMRLVIEDDYSEGNVAAIRSGMSALGGTWAARIKLPELVDEARMIAAFWTQQVDPFDNRYEMDFEFNNIWAGGRPGHPVMQVATHRDNPISGGREAARVVDCEYVGSNGAVRKGPECFDAQTGGNYFLGKHEPEGGSVVGKGPEDEYFHFIIRQYGTDRVEYAAVNEDYRGTGDLVRLGPVTIDEFVPTKPMQIMLATLVRGINTADGTLGRETTLAVDWVYYSPDQHLLELGAWEAIDAVSAEVASFRANGWPRVNTAGKLLFPPPLPRPD